MRNVAWLELLETTGKYKAW
jgi:hypothetical protein